MAKAEKLIPLILKWEGGYSNHPLDSGGCTMKGVTIGTFRSFFGKSKTCSELKNISDDQWSKVFKEGYWDKMGGDDIKSQSVADIIVDWAWLSGVKTVAKKIQKIVGVEADGKIGPVTIKAINTFSPKELHQKIYGERKKFYENLVKRNPEQKVFLNGWMNRLNDYKDFVEEESALPDEKKK